ncbi:MAG TPA: hypothetical protein VG733_14025 [Chthoniobacteraceae bacterium]|nr:hypothetical protein [Chthoniobacteraceae bacterium]
MRSIRQELVWLFTAIILVLAALYIGFCFLITRQPVEKNYVVLSLPNGDRLVIDRKDLGFDLPMAEYHCSTKSGDTALIASSKNTERFSFQLAGPGSDSVVAVVSPNQPGEACAIYDFRTGDFFPHDHPEDAAAKAEYAKGISALLSRLARATGTSLAFGDIHPEDKMEAR